MIQVQLYIHKIVSPDQITEEEILTLPAYRQNRIRAVKHASSKAALFTAGILLRDVLGVSEDEDLFFNEQEKPYLKSRKSYFSISHNNTYAVLATALLEIGVDVEEQRELSKALQKRVFTDEERFFIEQDPARNVVWLWTRLEAALKLSGEGVAGMDHRTFSLLGDQDFCRFSTIEHGNSIISVACREEFSLEIILAQ